MAKQNLVAKPQPAYLPIQARILQLYDEMAEFQDQCSFLCDAFASIAAYEEVTCDETRRGASVYCEWIKSQVHEMKMELKVIHSEINLLASVAEGRG